MAEKRTQVNLTLDAKRAVNEIAVFSAQSKQTQATVLELCFVQGSVNHSLTPHNKLWVEYINAVLDTKEPEPEINVMVWERFYLGGLRKQFLSVKEQADKLFAGWDISKADLDDQGILFVARLDTVEGNYLVKVMEPTGFCDRLFTNVRVFTESIIRIYELKDIGRPQDIVIDMRGKMGKGGDI